MWECCAATLPVSREVAKTQMSVTCGFLGWTATMLGSVDLGTVLTRDNINRFLRHCEGSVTDGTLQSRAGRLRRALRAAAGEAPRTIRGPRKDGVAPYSPGELDTLRTVATAANNLQALLDSLETPGSREPGKPAWQAARSAASAVGITLTRDRVRSTRAVTLLTLASDLGPMLRSSGLGTDACDRVLVYLPEDDEERVCEALRG